MHTIKHAKTSTIADSPDDGLVRPSDWNNSHSINWGVATPNVRTFDASMASGGDPDADKISLIINGDGADNSTVIVDSSLKNHSLVAMGTTKIKTNSDGIAPKFGSGKIALLMSHIACPVTNDLQFGTGDFTIEAWVLRIGDAGNGSSSGMTIISNRPGSGTDVLAFIFSNDSVWFHSNSEAIITLNTTINVGVWVHLAVSRQAGVIRIFRDGTLLGQANATNNFNNTAPFLIGLDGTRGDATTRYFNGYIGDLRITKGLARYTTDFSVPTIAHAIDLPGITLPDNQNYMSIGPITIDGVDVTVPNNCDWVIM